MGTEKAGGVHYENGFRRESSFKEAFPQNRRPISLVTGQSFSVLEGRERVCPTRCVFRLR